jgi:anti-anti-sigma factor
MADTAELRLHGEIDVQNSGAWAAVLFDQIAEVEGEEAVVDCSDLSFIDSSGLHMLTRLANRSGKRLILRGVSPAFRRALETTRLDQFFTLLD